MAKLKLGAIPDDRPVKVTLELPAPLHRDLVAYAGVLAQDTGQPAPDPVKLIVPMLERFIAADRGFAKARRGTPLGHETGDGQAMSPKPLGDLSGR
jgi:Uncharacterized conserved small protein